MSANIQRPPSVRGLTIEHDMALEGRPHMWFISHLRLLPTEALKNRATLGLIDSDTTFEQYTQTTTIQRSQPYLARSLDTRGCQLVHGRDEPMRCRLWTIMPDERSLSTRSYDIPLHFPQYSFTGSVVNSPRLFGGGRKLLSFTKPHFDQHA
ncbi:hypothetical protein FOXYSP1_00216 [Fusarium oxysporum f. sp. phaseoli]